MDNVSSWLNSAITSATQVAGNATASATSGHKQPSHGPNPSSSGAPSGAPSGALSPAASAVPASLSSSSSGSRDQMIRERDELIESLRSQLDGLKSALRSSEEDSKKQNAEIRSQLADAKAKAKEVIQRNILTFKAEKEELEAQIQSLKARIDELEEAISAGSVPRSQDASSMGVDQSLKVAQLNAELEQARKKQHESEIDLQTLKAEKDLIAQLEKDIRAQLQSIEASLEDTRNERDRALHTLAENGRTLAQMRESSQRADQLSAENSQLVHQQEQLEAQLQEMTERVSELQSASESSDSIREAMSSVMERNRKLESELARLSEDHEESISRLRDEMEDMKRQYERQLEQARLETSLNAQSADHDSIESLQWELETAKSENSALQKRVEESEAQVSELKESVNKQQAKFEAELVLVQNDRASSMESTQAEALTRVQSELEQAKNEAQLLVAKAKEREALVSSLQESVHNLKSEHEDQIEQLRSEHRSSSSEYEEQGSILRSELSRARSEISSLGEQINTKREREQELQREIDRLAESVRQLRDGSSDRMRELDDHCQKLSAELELAHVNLAKSQGAVRMEQEAQARLVLELESVKDKLANIETLEAANQNLHAQLQEVQKKVESYEGTVSELEEENAARVQSLESEIDRLQHEQSSKVGELHATCNSLKELVAQYETTIQIMENEKRSFSQQQGSQSSTAMHEMEALCNSLKEKLALSESAIKTLESEKEALSDKLKALSSASQISSSLGQEQAAKISQLESLVSELQDQVNLAESREKSLASRMHEAEDSARALQEEKIRLETKLADANSHSQASSDSELGKKVAALEVELAGKQSEILKVREKAKQYLKELNTEKRDLESRMQKQIDEADAARKKAVEDCEKALTEFNSMSREFDGMLSLIKEKDGRINTLISEVKREKAMSESLKEAAQAAEKEFESYRNRVLITLKQREEKIKEAQAETELLTRDLRRRAEEAEKQISELRESMFSTEDIKGIIEEKERRISELEQELLNHANVKEVGNNEIRQKLDLLQSHSDKIESELTSAQTQIRDGEARNAQLLLKLEMAERMRDETVSELEHVRDQHFHESKAMKSRVKFLEDQLATYQQELKTLRTQSNASDRIAAAARLAYESPAEASPKALNRMMTGSNMASNIREGRTGSAPMASPLAFNDIHDDMFVQLEDARSALEEYTKLLNASQEMLASCQKELKETHDKLAAAQQLQNGVPYDYLKNIVLRFLETDDLNTLLPVMGTVLSFTPEEIESVKAKRSKKSSGTKSDSNIGSSLWGRFANAK